MNISAKRPWPGVERIQPYLRQLFCCRAPGIAVDAAGMAGAVRETWWMSYMNACRKER